MTEFFKFEELTWPQVATLPRNIPMILALGACVEPDHLAAILGKPPRAALFPAMPYGWPGSGLEVPREIFSAYVTDLLNNMRQDGFTNVHLLVPDNFPWLIEATQIESPISQPESILHRESDRCKVILIPIGHTEQHAHHLPLSTDTVIIHAVSQGTAEKVPDQAFSLPVMPYGVSMHRSAFAGTFDAGGRAFEDFWLAVVDSLVMRGFDRFYLLSGHGGNMSFLVNVVKYAGDHHPKLSGRRIFCATAFLYLSGDSGVASLERHRKSAIGGMGHAGELETSLMLYLAPDLVDMSKVVDEIDFVRTASYYMDWIEGGALVANPPWEDDTTTGAYGAGSMATVEHGKIWLQAAIDEKVAHVGEIHEQFRRRQSRTFSV